MSNAQQGTQSTLQNVYSYSFTANNLFQVSLVKDNDPNRPNYKKQYFCFLTLAPGEQQAQGGRTYNFTNRISMKQDIHNIIALSYALRAVARGQKASIGNFSLFTDSSKSTHGQGGGVKQVFVNDYIKKLQNAPQNSNMQSEERFVSLGFRFGQNKPIGLMFSIPDALACADVLEFIGKMGLQLDSNGASVSFAVKAPTQVNQQPPIQNETPYPYQNNLPPNVSNSPDNIANNFQNGLTAAKRGGEPAMPPPMDDIMGDGPPF